MIEDHFALVNRTCPECGNSYTAIVSECPECKKTEIIHRIQTWREDFMNEVKQNKECVGVNDSDVMHYNVLKIETQNGLYSKKGAHLIEVCMFGSNDYKLTMTDETWEKLIAELPKVLKILSKKNAY